MPEEDKKKLRISPLAERPRAWHCYSLSCCWRGLASGFGQAGEARLPRTKRPGCARLSHLETFVLNLADADQRSYLQVGIDLGLNQEAKHGETAPVAQVRDTILGVLAEAKVNDLMTVTGKAKLKENLLHALQERMPQLGVAEVYFTEFLIQR